MPEHVPQGNEGKTVIDRDLENLSVILEMGEPPTLLFAPAPPSHNDYMPFSFD